MTATRSDQPSNVGYRTEMARQWVCSGGSVLLFGPVGVGKSAALDVLAATAGGVRVLRCAPGAVDADRAYRALAQLLSSVTESELSLLPAVRRRVLDGLLHRGTGSSREHALGRSRRTRWSTRATSTAVQLATWNLMRALARSRPLLLVVDNLERVDRTSADVLRFVASRVGDLAIQVVAAERVPADHAPVGRHVCPAPVLLTQPDALFMASLQDSPGWRRQGGNGAPWAVCRRSPDSVC